MAARLSAVQTVRSACCSDSARSGPCLPRAPTDSTIYRRRLAVRAAVRISRMACSSDASVVRTRVMPFALWALPLAVPFKDFTAAAADPFLAAALSFAAAFVGRLALGADLAGAADFGSPTAVWCDAM